MRRRQFITLLGSAAAAAWPHATRAQRPERMHRVAVLFNVNADDPGQQNNLVAFEQALQQLGWTEGRNVRIEVRWAGGEAREIRRHANELVALACHRGNWQFEHVTVAAGDAHRANRFRQCC
jgi:putative ABC transport system substrate-binding protein